MHTTTHGRCCILLSAVALLSACASTPSEKPDDALSKAQYAITQADKAVGREGQSVALYEAKQRLKKAQSLVANPKAPAKNYLKARRLAEEAALDARLAQSRAEAKQAQAHKAELQENLETLRQEIQHKGAGQ